MTYLDKYRDKLEKENGRMHVKMCDLDEDDLKTFYEGLFKKMISGSSLITMSPSNDADVDVTYSPTSPAFMTVNRIIIAAFLNMPNLRSRVKDGGLGDRCFIKFENQSGDSLRVLPDGDDKNEMIRRALEDEKTMKALKNKAIKIKGNW